ncbi:MAG TPA: hypothetical protein VG675_09415 [Bryobacteraceae bacterium]|nr:hypothetical protein [Bryobacteraceae bacterium]
MRVLCLFLFISAAASADDAVDRAAIEHLIGALNNLTAKPSVEALPALFTADVNRAPANCFLAGHWRLVQVARHPWSEVSTPRLETLGVEILAPGLALVDAINRQIGVSARRIPVLFVMKREGADWRIASIHSLVDCTKSSNLLGLGSSH